VDEGPGRAALLAVIGQGVLGGYRVRLNSTHLAAVHGGTAQAFFALTVALCVLTGRDWTSAGKPRPDPDHLRRRSLVTLVLVYGQIVAGVLLRHFGVGLASTPSWPWRSGATRRCWPGGSERRKGAVPELGPRRPRPGAGGLGPGGAGGGRLGDAPAVRRHRPRGDVAAALVRTGHQANGALLLAAAVVLTLRACRHLAPAARAAAAGVPARAPRDLEAVA
jgi:cytochrome c oxidase assembly protein subunit 15